ncbi:MAG: formate dehydrogenase-N subunit alpha [Acidobacteriia bacterium]|nr:formate dehydrogenase-N subunit alpha [Terriglobia bacterium]
MTNGWVDIKNADMILVMGGNPAENHPCGFKWAIEAKRNRNAKLLVVDPRFTRTAAVSDMFVQIRPGTDIAFLGGMINYMLSNGRVNQEYLANYTNAPLLIKEGFKLPEDGLYSGYIADKRIYDKTTWNYDEGGDMAGKTGATAVPASHKGGPATTKLSPGYQAVGTPTPAPVLVPVMPEKVAYDLTMQHPRCVYQLLKQQYSRYTPEMVERITGISKEQQLKAYDLFTSIRKGGDTKKVATVIYALGWTQHTVGTQNIRTAAMIQLLMGNIGRAGGGMNALRGHSNIQGATDMAGIFDILPGYLKVPAPTDADLKAFLERTTPKTVKPAGWDSFNYWSNTPRFMVSLLKAMYGDAAKKENDWAFHYLPKIDRNYGWAEIWDGMYAGKVKGLFAFGMNGVMIGPNTRKNIEALKKADWLVVCEIYPDETSEFWRAPGISNEEMKKINTTVYRLPGAGFAEKDGTFVNSARWLQWKNVALPPPGDCRLDQDILAQIYLKIRELYAKEGGKFPDPIRDLSWAYTNPKNPSLAECAKEINGKAIADVTDEKTQTTIKAGQQLPGFAFLRDDGSTSSGNWLYCGSWTEAGPLMQRRGTEDPSGLGIYPNWGWSWPMNRRVMYNRASCNLEGKPWDPTRKQVWWNAAAGKWVGNDVPDFKPDSDPKDHMGPFIMNQEGVSRLFVWLGDGPFPEHYEPVESPVANPLHPQQSSNPVAKRFKSDMDKYGTVKDGFNVVATTYRLTEHYHYWTKNNPMNVQLVPEPFVEIPAELANEMGLRGGEKLKVSSARSFYIGKAMVTKRIKPMTIDGKKTYQIGIPIHWGYRGISEDEGRTGLTPVNQLSPAAVDVSAFTPEFKAFLVKIERA